ncbi:MAG TPA: alpha-amylase family glycosyl hydrolase, partial [Mycobacteriales bacterium]|nr:alpha-amylase family glycosyl hydrolase [Mycobacteriales bacterium]
FRRAVKAQKPGAPLIAEAWHYNDNMPLTNGDTADTPMGYRFRAAVLSLLGATGDDKGFPGEDDPNVPVSQFAEAMESIRQDYPDATYRTFMNLLGTHDTARLRWMLTPGQNNPADREDDPQNVAVGVEKERVAATLQFTLPGMPSIYYGDEVGVTGSDDPDNRRTFPWTANGAAGGNHDLLDLYESLSRMRASHAVFRDGDVSFLLSDDAHQTLAFASRTAGDAALVVVNRGSSARTVSVPTASVLRDGVLLQDALAPGQVRTDHGRATVSVPAMSAAVLTAAPHQDLAAPTAPAGFQAIAGDSGAVTLSWRASAGARQYSVYRSPLDGGGYEKVGTTRSTSIVDKSAAFGAPAHYVVRAEDAAGNISADSAQATVVPSVPVQAARITSPAELSGQVSLTGVPVTAEVRTPGSGTVLAQAGYQDGSGWHWSPMTGSYSGTVRPAVAGTYPVLVRFSTDDGATWTYAGPTGIGRDDPAILHLAANPDTTPPSAPQASIDWSISTLTVSWAAGPDVAEYRVYRADSAAGPYTEVGTVTGQSYVDPDVSPGETHYYQVRAVDAALNVSAPSAPVGHQVEAKLVQVTFRVAVPANTPAGQTVYVAGATTNLPPGMPDPLCLWCGGNADTAMHQVSDGIWEATFGIPEGAGIQWKYTRGDWTTVEVRAQNRSGQVGHDATQLIDDTGPGDAVTAWQDLS